MRRLVVLLALAACRPDAQENAPAHVETAPQAHSAAAPKTEAPAHAIRVTPAPSDGDAASLIRTQRLAAKAEGRVLVVYVGATWCEPCQHFKAEIASGRLDARLAKITLLAFDADRDTERLGAAGYAFQFVPYVALPGPDGKPAASLEAKGQGNQAWKELLGKLEAWQS